MEVGDTVTLASDPNFRGTLVKLPRCVGRKSPRALVQSTQGEQWYTLESLRPAEADNE